MSETGQKRESNPLFVTDIPDLSYVNVNYIVLLLLQIHMHVDRYGASKQIKTGKNKLKKGERKGGRYK